MTLRLKIDGVFHWIETAALHNAIKQLQSALTTSEQSLEAADKQIGWLKGDKDRLNKSIKARDGAMHAFIDLEEKAAKKLTDADAENERLKEFARHIIRQYCWDMLEPDGGDIQEWAEKLGLIVGHTATEKDVDDESDFEVGESIFKFSETLKGD